MTVPQPSLPRAGAAVTSPAVAADISDLVDARVGVIKSLTRLPKGREEPELPHVYQAVLSHFDYRRGESSERTASGKGRTDAEAMRGAIAEALERYCAYHQRSDALVFAEAAALDAPAIPPEAFVLYSQRQYSHSVLPYRRPAPGQSLTWVVAEGVASGERLYVPASLVYMNFVGAGGSELFAPTTSNGLAAGPDRPSAVLSGLRELIERDAFLITWLNRLPAPRIEIIETNGLAEDIRRHYCQFGIEVLAFDLTTDIGIPVIMALAIDRSGSGPSVISGLGCHLRAVTALDKAMMEICQMRAGAVPLFRRNPPVKRLRSYVDVRTLEDHAAFAALPERLGEFSFLLDHDRRVRIKDLANLGSDDAVADLETCRGRLEAAGSTAAFVDLTQPDVQPYGMTVVRSLATGLQPIHFGHNQERLGGRRLFTVPRILGYVGRDTTEDELNPCPHPLA